VEDLKNARATGGEQVAKLQSQFAVAVEELKKANADSAGILKALDDARKQIAELTAQKEDLLRDRQGSMEEVAARSWRKPTRRPPTGTAPVPSGTKRSRSAMSPEGPRGGAGGVGAIATDEPDFRRTNQGSQELARGEVEELRGKLAQMEQAAARSAGELKERDELIKTLRAELQGTGGSPARMPNSSPSWKNPKHRFSNSIRQGGAT